MIPTNSNAIVEGDTAIAVNDETSAARQNAGDVTTELDAIVRAYKSKRATHTRRKYAEYRERGGPASCTSFEEWAGHELGARMDQHRRRMMASETSRRERVDLIALEELYARAEYVAPVKKNGDHEHLPFEPAERLEWDHGRRSDDELTELQRLFVVTWRKHKAALRREKVERRSAVRELAESRDELRPFPDGNRSSAEAGSTTDRRGQGEGDETSATRPKAGDLVTELDAIARAYKSERAVHTRRKYAEYCERGGPASLMSFDKWAGYELGARVNQHKRRMMASWTTRRERVDLLALEELYARAEYVGTGRRVNQGERERGAATEKDEDEDLPLGPAAQLEWDHGRRSNDDSTDLQRLFVVTWRKHWAALRREKAERRSAVRSPAEACSTTDRREQGEGDETSATRQKADELVMELDAIARAYQSERAAHTRRTYAEYCERGGPASRTSFDKWAGYELGARVNHHKRRMMASGTTRHERVDLIALEELYARAEHVGTGQPENHGVRKRGAVTVNDDDDDVDNEDLPVGSAERRPEWDEWARDGRRSNDVLTDLQRLFVVTWRKRNAALRRERKMPVSESRPLGFVPDL